MADRLVDVEQALSDVAGIVPGATSSQRAIASVRAALDAQTPQRKRWILPLSLAAGVMVVAALVFSILQRPASAAENLAATLKTNQAYKGWVHMSYGGPEEEKLTILHWNSETGVLGRNFRKINIIYFQNPKTGEFQRYDGADGLVRIGALSSDAGETLREFATATPLNFQDMLDHTQQKLREAAATIKLKQPVMTVTETSDRGMKRFDLHALDLRKDSMGVVDHLTGSAPGYLDFPTTLWVDSQSGLIRQLMINGKEITLTYGGPDITSVYDLGAPRTAKIYDNRPSAETLALCDRISARIDKPMPNGVSVFLISSSTEPAFMLVHSDNGKQWTFRNYNVDQPGKTSIQVPQHWADTGADELFRRMSATLPHFEHSSDAQTAKYTDFEETDPMVRYPDSIGRGAVKERFSLSPTRRLYPAEPLNSRFGIDNHLDLQTSSDRPGQIALHDLWHENSPELIRRDHLYWLDTAHDDRPITYIESSYYDETQQVLTKDIHWTTRTEFDAYDTLPAPDGRTYPTHWIKTTTYFHLSKDGKIPSPTREEVTFHFFPDKLLPPLPKKPITQP